MTLVQSMTLEKTTRSNRVIDHIKGKKRGPTVVFFGGVHGNETAGVFALKNVFGEIRSQKTQVNGELYAISGNLGALESRQRFQDEDLNRIWLPERIERIVINNEIHHNEENELNQLYLLVQDILKKSNPPFYFLDSHNQVLGMGLIK